jgi:hypothetical protein
MYGPVRKRFLRGDLTGLRQRIRSGGSRPGQDGGPRAPVLKKSRRRMRHLLNQDSRAPGQPSGHFAFYHSQTLIDRQRRMELATQLLCHYRMVASIGIVVRCRGT